MTKGELLAQLDGYPDDAVIEIVRYGDHYDLNCVVPYDDHGIPILELGISVLKTVPESKKVNNA
jgi:hypothetical protein